MSLDEIKAFADAIMQKFVQPGQRLTWPHATYELQIKDGRSRRFASANTNGFTCILTFPKNDRFKDVVCHEVAHLIAWNESKISGGWHGPAFVRVLIQVVREFLGPYHAARLVFQLQLVKVKIND